MRVLAWFLVAVGVLLVLAMVVIGPGTVWINSFIHSDAFRHEVEVRAGRTLGGTVEIKEIDFGVWSGITLSGLATKLDTTQGTVVAQVESVSCSYSLLALLTRRLQLDGLTLAKPQIVLTQQPPSTVPTPAAPPGPATGEATAGEAQSGQTSPFQVVLEGAKISDGRLSIRDTTSATKADLQGVQVAADTSGYYNGKDVTGTLRIANVALPQNLGLTDFSTPFTYRTGAMAAGPFQASAFGGQLTGDYKLDPSGPSLLEVNATRIDMLKIGQTANPGSSTRLSGSLALQSKWSGVETGKLTGSGDAQITDARLQGVSILHDLSIALQVPALNEPELKSVTTHFEVADGSTRFTHLLIESTVFEMAGDGVIDAQGQLNANMILTLHGDAMGGIPGAAASFFSKLPGGAGSIPFHIGGTVGDPKADLSTRLFLQGSQVEKSLNKTLNKAINHFFH